MNKALLTALSSQIFLFLSVENKTEKQFYRFKLSCHLSPFCWSPLQQSSQNCLYTQFSKPLFLFSLKSTPSGFHTYLANQTALVHALLTRASFPGMQPELRLMLWCHHLEILNFWTRGHCMFELLQDPQIIQLTLLVPFMLLKLMSNPLYLAYLTYQLYLVRPITPSFIIPFCFPWLPHHLTLLFFLLPCRVSLLGFCC